MFSSLGLLKDVSCPQLEECSLLHCFFSHQRPKAPEQSDVAATPEQSKSQDQKEHVSRATSVAVAVVPKKSEIPEQTRGLKRPSLSQDQEPTRSSYVEAARKSIVQGGTNVERIKKTTISSLHGTVTPPEAKRAKTSHVTSSATIGLLSTPAITTKPARNNAATTALTPANSPAASFQPAKPKTLTPRTVAAPPEKFDLRLSYIKKIYGFAVENNKIATHTEDKRRIPDLSEQELIDYAVDEEYKLALVGSIYKQKLGHLLMRLSKKQSPHPVQWKMQLLESIADRERERLQGDAPPLRFEYPPRELGINRKQEFSLLKSFKHEQDLLKRAEFIISPPTEHAIWQFEEGQKLSKGLEVCDRCKTRFKIFDGRREEDGALTGGGTCSYHWGKVVRPMRAKTDAQTGQGENLMSCCNESIGQSTGCVQASNHVFKISSPAGLASVLQFQETPANSRTDLPKAICLDCEMGYTTRGLELIRFTATSWPTGVTVADVLVRPQGEILDLNSRFSGVWPRHMTESIPFEPGKEVPTDSDPNSTDKTPKHIMASPAAARSLLFQYLTPTTPLLGHALENDVNTLRIIHPCIVDSALLYPHKAGLPYRRGLKALMASELQRTIQTAGVKSGADAGGHDSREDANAAGELIRHYLWQQWKTMRFGGWKFEGEKLVPPPGKTMTDTTAGTATPTGPKKRPMSELRISDQQPKPRAILRNREEVESVRRPHMHRVEASHHQGRIEE